MEVINLVTSKKKRKFLVTLFLPEKASYKVESLSELSPELLINCWNILLTLFEAALQKAGKQ